MYVKIGDIKLMNIRVIKDSNTIYEGMVEEAPDEIKELNYKTANFQSGYIILEV